MKPLDRILSELIRIPGVQILSTDFMIHFLYKSSSCYLYAKRITPLSGGAPAERTRAQLSSNEHFKLLKPEDRFLFFGWDVENDVFTCWDPVNTKSRLNRRETVSLHSRLSAQQSVKSGEIEKVRLKNGELLTLMRPEDLEYFLANIEHYFPTLMLTSVEASAPLWNVADAQRQLKSHSEEAIARAVKVLNDSEITDQICEAVECGYSKFSIIQLLSGAYEQYPDMTLSDWKLLLDIVCDKMNMPSEAVDEDTEEEY